MQAYKRSKILAYGSVPKDTGTYTLYQTLRNGLREYGWDTRCVSIGAKENADWNPLFADDGCVRIAPHETNSKRQSIAFAEWCSLQGVAAVMPVNSIGMLGALPHLPIDTRIVARCADSTDFGYRRTTYARERVSRFIATTPRHVEDLVSHYDISRERITLIPHGIDVDSFRRSPNRGLHDGPLRLAYLGRLEHHQKGVLYIPAILRRLGSMGIDYQMIIVGGGVDGRLLRNALKPSMSAGRVEFRGTLPRNSAAEILCDSDILLVPSHHEGFGFVIIEGMATGCVVIASRLKGVTDFIVNQEETGFLCPVGNADAFAHAIARLANNRILLQTMSERAVYEAHERFDQKRMVSQYATAFDQAMSSSPPNVEIRSWDSFVLPDVKYKSRFPFVPASAKRVARQLAKHMIVRRHQ